MPDCFFLLNCLQSSVHESRCFSLLLDISTACPLSLHDVTSLNVFKAWSRFFTKTCVFYNFKKCTSFCYTNVCLMNTSVFPLFTSFIKYFLFSYFHLKRFLCIIFLSFFMLSCTFASRLPYYFQIILAFTSIA